MSRQLRISYPGAFYHVYSRGNQKQAIYFCDDDRYFFLKILRDAQERYEAAWHLYCLMDSHYHLGLQTPKANVSQIMHFVDSAYAIHLNIRYGRCGHLFQGRYKAILVQADLYAKALAKYIHYNPVRKGFVERPEQYEWSSCQDYFGLRHPPSWLITRMILDCFGGSAPALRTEHEMYRGETVDLSFENDLKVSSRTGILGDDDFIDKLRRSILKDRLRVRDDEIGGLKKLRIRPELSLIRHEVCRGLGEKNRLEKKLTILLAHRYADYKLREIGEFLGIGTAGVSSSFHKIDKEVESNETLQRAVELIRSRVLSESSEMDIRKK
ncbi:MAG TPA: transposase [Acidobacteriota bacterium]|nr:transposase [Acidobacteriota bacterium]